MKITTFYSYKGGLGRSVLLAAVARSLAARGAKIVCIDLDLEAPGLAHKMGFSSQDDLGGGVVELLRKIQLNHSPPDSITPYLRSAAGESNLWLLPAGPFDTDKYWERLVRLDSSGLFMGPDPQGLRFLVWLQESIERDVGPDHILIDARTGITEMGGAALAFLSDQILALTGTSQESLAGTRAILRSVLSARASDQSPYPRISVVLSRVPASLDPGDLVQLKSGIRDQLNQPAEQLVATLAVGEPLVVCSEDSLLIDEFAAFGARRLRVHSDYRAIVNWVDQKTAPDRDPSARPDEARGVHAPYVENVRIREELLLDSGTDADRVELAIALFQFAAALFRDGRAAEAIVQAEHALHELDSGNDAKTLLWRIRRVQILFLLAELYKSDGQPLRSNERLKQAAVEILEASDHVDTPTMEFAGVLEQLGGNLAAAGMIEASIQVSEKAVKALRSLPSGFEPGNHLRLATALNNLGNRLSMLGHKVKALEASRESVGMFRTLAEADLVQFRPMLAGALTNFANMLGANDLYGDGRRIAEEAVHLYRELCRSGAAEHLPDLVRALHGLANLLDDLGLPNEAVKCQREVITHLKEIEGSDPDLYRPLLAAARSNLAISLNKLGSSDEALRLALESARQLRELKAGGSLVAASAEPTAVSVYHRICKDAGRQPEEIEVGQKPSTGPRFAAVSWPTPSGIFHGS